MMTLDEMKSAVCKKLPELLTNVGTPQQTVVDYWHDKLLWKSNNQSTQHADKQPNETASSK